MCQFPAYLDFWALYQVQSINKSIWFKFDLFFWVHFQFPLSTRFVQRRSLIVCSPLRTWDNFFWKHLVLKENSSQNQSCLTAVNKCFISLIIAPLSCSTRMTKEKRLQFQGFWMLVKAKKLFIWDVLEFVEPKVFQDFCQRYDNPVKYFH